jgi:hypothetical protein
MHLTWHFIFLIAALVLGILATLNVPGLPRFTWGWGCLTTLIVAMFFT